MDEVKKLLDESYKRLQDISDLTIENLTGDVIDTEICKLYDIAKEMDNIKQQTKIQHAALNHCKSCLSQTEEPWNCNIHQIFQENLSTEDVKNNKSKEEYMKSLKKHVKKKQNLDNDEMEVVEEIRTGVVDPWTKQPIQQAIQSKTCKHMYDKRSIACIIRNRNQFKCPYVGCQNVVTKEDLVNID